jgi:hypothetical protein
MVPERSVLVTPLDAVPDDGRACLGIHQSDVVLRTAIIAGMDDLRANPDILDYVFASLPKDPLTKDIYGAASVEDAKKWFLETEVPVMMNTRVDESKVPCITIGLLSSVEDTSSIGDVHYQASEPGPDKVLVYSDYFQVTRYDSSNGECFVPVNLDLIFPGMIVLDGGGRRHIIREVWDDRLILDADILTDFGRCRIVTVERTVVSLESVQFKESFQITCHAPNEPVYLTYLHSILVFVLLRYKEELIEARGLERTTLSSGEIYLNTSFTTNIVFSRPITVVGYVRNYWPKAIKQPILGIQTFVESME